MSSKLNVKAKGKESRPKSSDRGKKRRDGTPDKSSTPSQEPEDSVPPSKQVIWDEEIDRLQIRPHDLPKVWPPRPPESQKPLTSKVVPVHKERKLVDGDKPKSRMVSVAKPAPPDAPVKPVDYTGYAGPRYDEHGSVISHSLLGTYEDFHREAVRRGHLPGSVATPRGGAGGAETPSLKYERKRKTREVRLSRDDNNALRNWQIRMMERKRQQGYISKLLQKAPEDLAMNQADDFRQVQERRYLIDRTIPRVDYGKGYRVGSEFWQQHEQFGDDLTGLHMTLTQSQRGYPPPVEHVGLSQVTKGEKGCMWQGQRAPPTNHPWSRSQFLNQRETQLGPYMEELDPFLPDFAALQIIGRNKPYDGGEGRKTEEEEEERAYDQLLDSYGNPHQLSAFEEGVEEGGVEEGGVEEGEGGKMEVWTEGEGSKEPVFGPSLLFGGQAARWTGDSFSFKDQVGIEARVTFEALTGDRITSYLEIVNDGTTSVYYDWKKMAKENPFDLVQAHVQRFYFNNSSGVILPGETLKFPYVFKSPNAGVFTEQWGLETRPVVCGGAALLVTLRGVALQEDKYKRQREELEKELVQKQAQQVVSQLLHQLIAGIRTPERSRSPVDAYITDEEIFRRNNPGLEYSHELVSQLRDLYSQLFEEGTRAENVWSLSVADLQESILQMDEDDEKRENLLHQMNSVVAKLSYLPHQPMQQKLRCAGYQLFQEAVDRLVSESLLIRQTLGLPEREQDDLDGDTSDSRKGARAGDNKSKPDANKDKGKPPAKEVKVAKAPAGKPDPKGKTTPASAQKKAPTPVKTAPTPALTAGANDKDGAEGSNSQPSSPDPGASLVMSDADVTTVENLYRDSLRVKVYDILGDMADKMDLIFSAFKDGQENPT